MIEQPNTPVVKTTLEHLQARNPVLQVLSIAEIDSDGHKGGGIVFDKEWRG